MPSDTSRDMPGHCPIDPYFALLERPSLRLFGIDSARVAHRTPSFDAHIYQASCRTSFATEEEAYVHWVSEGRSKGLAYAPGKDTLLKIVLKAKDEPDLIDLWISHHAAIVGYENILVMDCGSTDPTYLRKLNGWSEKVIVLRYEKFFNCIHDVSLNSDLFDMLRANASYVCILDADEFLFGRSGNKFSPVFIKDLLRRRLDVVCGIWIDGICEEQDGMTSLPTDWRVDICKEKILGNSFAGKSIVSTRIMSDIELIGHNLHHPACYPYIQNESFGSLFILHLTTLPRRMIRARTLKKLATHAGIRTGSEGIVMEELGRLLSSDQFPENIKDYARLYMSTEAHQIQGLVPTGEHVLRLLCDEPQSLPSLFRLMSDEDFDLIIRHCWDMIRGMMPVPENMPAGMPTGVV